MLTIPVAGRRDSIAVAVLTIGGVEPMVASPNNLAEPTRASAPLTDGHLGAVRNAAGHLLVRTTPGGWFTAARRPSACRGPGAGRAPGRVRSAAAAVRVAGGHQGGDGGVAGLDV